MTPRRRSSFTACSRRAAAVALYRKFGFGIEGSARGHALRHGGYVDAFMVARHAPAPAHRAPPDASVAGNA